MQEEAETANQVAFAANICYNKAGCMKVVPERRRRAKMSPPPSLFDFIAYFFSQL